MTATIKELREFLQKLENQGKGDYEVYFDGYSVYIDESYLYDKDKELVF